MLEPDSTARTNTEAFDLILRALRKHWLLGVVIWLTVFGGVVFYTIGQKRIYRASATVQIDPNPPRPLGEDVKAVVDVGNGSYWDNKEYYLTQVEILRGRALARETARVLGLQVDLAFLVNAPQGAALPKEAKAASLDITAAALQGRIAIELIKDSRLVTATLDDANPERARRILSSFIDIYLERNIGQVVRSSAAAGEWLRGQTEKLKNELETSELALYDYKKDKRILSVSLDDQSNMLRGEMQQLSAALTAVSARRENLEARVHELDKIDLKDPTTLPVSELLSSSILSTLRETYSQAKGELASTLSFGKGEKHPSVEAARAKVESARQSLLGEVTNVQGALRSELVATTQEAKGLAGLFERAKQRAFDLNILEIEYRRLERSKVNTEKLFGLVLERSKESDITGMLRFNNISVVESPVAGTRPISPKVPANLALGLILGMAISLGFVVSLEWFDRTLRVPQDVEDATGLPFLGLLPSLSGKLSSVGYYSRRSRGKQVSAGAGIPPGASVELVVHTLPSSNAAECARGIRTSLSFASPDKPYKTILVTSATPSEGKTTIATTIAITFAQTGQRVLVVDCDLRRARLHRVFRQNSATGVSSVLQSPGTLDDAIVVTQVPNLSLLPAGPHVPNPAELLQSVAFDNLLLALIGKFDRIVIDSPPVMVVTDATVLSRRVDATVVVFRARKTKRDVARQVVRKLTELGGRVAGVVLNAMEEPKSKGGYYYGYYSRDKYRSDGETDSVS